MIYAVILHFESPLQSWGIDSRFQHRSAGSAPSKSAVCGMICAACGAAKASSDEADIIARFKHLKMDCFSIKGNGLMVDYHTIQNFRRASGKIDATGTVLTQRHYWQNSYFRVVLSSDDKDFIFRIYTVMQNPVWGIWLGRKCCIPAAPIIREAPMEYSEAREKASHNFFEAFSEVEDFESGTDTWFDQPLGFGHAHSSGCEGRTYSPRRINHYIPANSGDTGDFFCF